MAVGGISFSGGTAFGGSRYCRLRRYFSGGTEIWRYRLRRYPVLPNTAVFGGDTQMWRHRLQRLGVDQNIKIQHMAMPNNIYFWRPINRRTSFLSFRMGLFLSLVCTLESLHLPYDFVISRCDAYPWSNRAVHGQTKGNQKKKEKAKREECAKTRSVECHGKQKHNLL